MPDELIIRRMSGREEAEIFARALVASEPWITLRADYELTFHSLCDTTRERYVGIIGNKLAGIIVLNLSGPFRGYVQLLFVLPEFQKLKVGRKLIRFAEERVFRDYPNVFLCVSSFNTNAQRFYQELGYSRIGEIPNYIVAGHSEFLMRKTLGPTAR